MAESRKFLDEIEAAVQRGLDLHLVMDKYATHKARLMRDGNRLLSKAKPHFGL